MNVMHRFTLKSLGRNKKWTIVTIIGVIISAAMLTAVSTFVGSFIELMRTETIRDGGDWHAIISGAAADRIDTVRQDERVEEILLSRDVGYAALEGSQNPNKPYLYIKEMDAESITRQGITLLEGRLPQSGDELAIPAHLSENGGVAYQIGDTLTLSVGRRINTLGYELDQRSSYDAQGGDILTDQAEKTYTVVGIIERPNNGLEPSWAPGYTAISYLDTDTLAASDPVDVGILVSKISTEIYGQVNAIAASVGVQADNVRFNDELFRYYGVSDNDHILQIMYGFALVIILIIMVASVSLIYNAFAISVSERSRQLGMLSSVGATRAQKRRSVYFEGLLIGLIGIPGGILAGIAGIGITIAAIRPLMDSFFNSETKLTLVVSPLSLAVAAAFGALTIFVSVYIPARRASKIMPIDAIRMSKEVKMTRRTIKTSRLTRLLFGFEGELALKNLKRSRKKYRATVVSLIISLVLFLTVSSYAQIGNMFATLDSEGINFDIALYNIPQDKRQAFEAELDKLELVEQYAQLQTVDAVLENAQNVLTGSAAELLKDFLAEDGTFALSATIISPDDAEFDRYAKSIGEDPDDYRTGESKAILINYGQGFVGGKLTSGAVIKSDKGDTLSLTYIQRQSQQDTVDGQTTTTVSTSELDVKTDFLIGATTDERPLGQTIQGFSQVALVIPRVQLAGILSKHSEIAVSADTYFLTSPDPEALETELFRITGDLSLTDASLYNIASYAKSQRNVLIFLGVFVYGFITLISLICIANIFNTVSTNVALRRKEFAMLRSVGMTPRSFNKMIRFESIFYGLKALLYGIPISVGIAYLLHRLQTDNLVELPFTLPWMSYLIAMVIIFFIVGSTMLYSTAKIKKENIIDALKTDIS